MHAKRAQIYGTNSDGQENLYLNSKIDMYREWNSFNTIFPSYLLFFKMTVPTNAPNLANSKSILPWLGPNLVSRSNSWSNIQWGSYRGGGSFHGPRAKKLTHHESRIFKFHFKALHVSREIFASRSTKNIFLKSRFSVNKINWSRITKIPLYDPLQYMWLYCQECFSSKKYLYSCKLL